MVGLLISSFCLACADFAINFFLQLWINDFFGNPGLVSLFFSGSLLVRIILIQFYPMILRSVSVRQSLLLVPCIHIMLMALSYFFRLMPYKTTFFALFLVANTCFQSASRVTLQAAVDKIIPSSKIGQFFKRYQLASSLAAFTGPLFLLTFDVKVDNYYNFVACMIFLYGIAFLLLKGIKISPKTDYKAPKNKPTTSTPRFSSVLLRKKYFMQSFCLI